MNHIWMYWEDLGRGMPEFVRLCMESVIRHKGRAIVHVLNQTTVLELLPDLRAEWHRLQSPAHKADYVRTRLVCQYGGMWLDSDMAVLSDLEPLFEIPAEHDFACQSMEAAIGCFVARPGCSLLVDMTKAQDQVLDRNPNDFSWNGIGNDLFKRLGATYPHHAWQKWTVDEIAGGKVTRLLSTRQTPADNVDGNAVVFHCCGNVLTPLLRTYARRQHQNLLHEKLLLSQIVRRALGIEEPSGLQTLLPTVAQVQDAGDGVLRRLGRFRSRLRREPVKAP